jgi:hypothetical protein
LKDGKNGKGGYSVLKKRLGNHGRLKNESFTFVFKK